MEEFSKITQVMVEPTGITDWGTVIFSDHYLLISIIGVMINVVNRIGREM